MVQLEIDPLWNEYMKTPKGAGDLAVLLRSEHVVFPFKDRALQTLLAPDVNKLPFTVMSEGNRRNFLGEIVDLRGILRGQEDLKTQAVTLTEHHIEELSRRPSILGSNRDTVSDLYEYQFVILVLLPVVHPEQAAKLFSHFRVDTPASWDIGTEVHSPYLLRALYHDYDIEEVYKRQAATQTHEIIQRSPVVHFAGKEGNLLAQSYGQDLDLLVLNKLGGAQLSVSRQFFQDEVAFLLGVDTGKPVLSSWVTTAEAVQLLDDPGIKHGFLRRQFLPWNLEFSNPRVYDSLTDATAALQVLLACFPEDRELATSIQAQLLKIEERERLKAGQPRSDSDAVLLSRMI